MKKSDFRSRFSSLRRSIFSTHKYSENKAYSALATSFVTGKSLSTTASNKSYYIIGDSSRRFLMHNAIPLAYVIQSGPSLDIYKNISVDQSLAGISMVFSSIQKFYTKGNSFIWDMIDLNNLFGTKDVEYKIDVSGMGFSSLFDTLINSKSLPGYDVFLKKFEESQNNPKYRNFYLKYKDSVLGPDDDYELVDIKHSNVIYSGSEGLDFVSFKNKFKNQIMKLMTGDAPAGLSGEVVEDIKRLPSITLNSSEYNVLFKLNSPEFDYISEMSSSYGVSSYYDFVLNMIANGKMSPSGFQAKTVFDEESKLLSDESDKSVLKNILVKMSKAFLQLTSGDNQELVALAKSSGMVNFFTYLDTQDIKNILNDVSKKNVKTPGLLKEDKGSLSKSIDAIYKFNNAFMAKVRSIVYKKSRSEEGNKEGIEVLASVTTRKLIKEINDIIGDSVTSLFSDPEIIGDLKKTSTKYSDMVSKLLNYGGTVDKELRKIPPSETANKFFDITKEFIVKLLSNKLSDIYIRNETENPFQKLLPDILRFHSFTESVNNADLKSKLQSGYFWSGAVLGETEITYSITDGIIDLPVGFLSYTSGETRKDHLGQGHILRLEVKDNFIRISLPSFYIGLGKVHDDVVMRRILKLEIQYARDGEIQQGQLVENATARDIIQEDAGLDSDNKEIQDFVRSGNTVMYLAKNGELIDFVTSIPADYYTVEGILTRGLSFTDLQNLNSKMGNSDMSRKYRKVFLQRDIEGALNAYSDWIDNVIKKAEADIKKISLADPKFTQKALLSPLGWRTDRNYVIKNSRMTMEMKLGDTGAFNVHSIFSLWDTYNEEREGSDGEIISVEKVRPVINPYFRRSTPNPAFVRAFLQVGLSNAAKDKIDLAVKYSKVVKKTAADIDKYLKDNGIEYSYQEEVSKTDSMPTISEGDIVSGYTKVIEYIKQNYFQVSKSKNIGVGVHMTVDPSIINKEGREVLRRIVESQAEIKNKYYDDLIKIIELLQEIHQSNQDMVALVTGFKAKESIGTTHHDIVNLYREKVSEQYKIELKSVIGKAWEVGDVLIESIAKDPSAFLGSENLSPDKFTDAAMNKFSESFIKILQGLADEVVNERTKVNQLTKKEDPELPDYYKKNLDKFMQLNNKIRQSSLKLLTLAAGYKLKKSAMMDLIKSGRVQNYLQYEQEVAKDNKPADGTQKEKGKK